MVDPQVFMGVAIAGLCVVAIVNEQWLLSNTGKGQRLSERFGKKRAQWMARALFWIGALFGAGLAGGLVNPIRWN